jgi:hypothetical protein
MALVTSSRGTAGVRQPVKLDVQELGWAVNAANVQDLAQSDDLKGLFGQNYLRIVPTLAGHPDLIVPDPLKNQPHAVRF